MIPAIQAVDHTFSAAHSVLYCRIADGAHEAAGAVIRIVPDIVVIMNISV